MRYEGQEYENAIAIIGMSGRFPKSKNLEEYWDLITEGKEGITFFTEEDLAKHGVSEEEYSADNYVKAGALLEGYEKFDNDFFEVNPREAELMDPQQRLFLQTCYEALEEAGYCAGNTDAVIGVYGGSSLNSFMIHNLMNNKEFTSKHEALQHIFVHGNMNDYLCTRVSYKLNLNGPSMSVQSACSTSATATYLAYQALLNYDCDIALAGGVSVRVPHYAGYSVVDGGIFSGDGHCRAFDNDSDGTVFGNGVGVIVLKRLSDAIQDNDNIIAIMRGAGLNNDGNLKVGYSAPSVEGQRDAIIQALEFAEVDPEEIGYVEMHGTGTKLGDVIEIKAIDSAYKQYTTKTGYCPIGSVKANIGHLNAASGVASIIKTALVVNKGFIPPIAAFRTQNKEIPFSETPFYVNTELKEWNDNKRIAGVSSFGIGGTNVHFILENYEKEAVVEISNKHYLFQISGKTETAAINNAANLLQYLQNEQTCSLNDISKTLISCRRSYNYRIGIAADSKEDLIHKLQLRVKNYDVHDANAHKKVVFMFPGQGVQYPGMLKGLYNASVFFREKVDSYFDIFASKVDYSVDSYKFFEEETNNTAIVQPVLFIWEYVMAEYLQQIGIKPDIVLGHSLGEFTAACVAKVFSVEDAITILIKRGELANRSKEGRMLSINLPFDAVKEFLGNDISLSVVNSDSNCVVSGSIDVIDRLKEILDKKGSSYVVLRNTRAFHSHLLNEYYEEFKNYMDGFEYGHSQVKLISNVTGNYVDYDEISKGDYWAKHLCEAVKFNNCVKTLAKEKNIVVIEAGTNMLEKIIKSSIHSGDLNSFVRGLKDTSEDDEYLFAFIARLWETGNDFDFQWILEDLAYDLDYYKTSLPTYAFDYKSFCLGEVCPDDEEGETIDISMRRRLSTEYVAPENEIQEECVKIWSETLGVENIGIDDDFFELGGHSLIATQVLTKVREMFGASVKLSELSDEPTVRVLSNLIVENLMQKLAHQ